MTRSERVYRALLRAYPPSIRDMYGDDMAQLFADQLRDAPTHAERAALWTRVIADALVDAPRQRLTGRRAVRVAAGPAVGSARPLTPDVVAAAWPIALTMVLLIVAPNFLGPLFDERASLLGAPFGIAVLAVLALLATLGLFAFRRGGVRDGRSRLLAAAILAVPIPTLVYLYGPEATLRYGPVAAFVVAVMSVRWLSFAVAVPFVLWLLVGPSVVLILINLGTPLD
jgi:hypothetical protein